MMFPVAAFASRPATLTLASAVVEGPPSMTNAQKLALDPATAVGTQVAVSDGFVVSGLTGGWYADCNGFFYPAGIFNGKTWYSHSVFVTTGDPSAATTGIAVYWDTEWLIHNALDGAASESLDDTTFPWEGTWIDDGGGIAVLTHPAIQQLAAPSTAQGGVFVSGGTQDGIYTNRGADNAKAFFNQLGAVDSAGADGLALGIGWQAIGDYCPDSAASGNGWIISDPGGSSGIYYSLSDVATPDLATDWKNASDDTSASITVTSVSVGELYAGLAVTNDGVTNGSSYVSQPFHGRQYYMGLNGGGSNNMHWDTDFNVWTDDVGEWTASNVAFPWQGTDAHSSHNGATFARNNVANEANWGSV